MFLMLSSVNTASLLAQTVKRLPAMQETRIQSLGWEDPRRKKWQPTPVILPGKFHGLRSLVGYSPWGCKEPDTTEQLHFHFTFTFSKHNFESLYIKSVHLGS